MTYSRQKEGRGVLVVGDVHGDFGHLNKLINKKKPKIVLQCGDFGWLPAFHGHPTARRYDSWTDRWVPFGKPFDQYGVKPGDSIVYWADGNHEDHWNLEARLGHDREAVPVMPKVFYQPRGSTVILPDGRTVLFFGGAKSVDRHLRTIGIDWWPNEVIGYRDTMHIPEGKVDIVVSHTCPREVDIESIFPEKEKDCSRDGLSRVLELCQPDLWYFGHFHDPIKREAYGCRFFGLNMAGRTGWWRWLDELK